jgi:cardiolipin synthase
MALELLVDAAEFWPRLAADLAAARERAYVQALSIEGDATGWALARALIGSPARDKRLIADRYVFYNLADRWVHAPGNLLDPALRALLRGTRRMFASLEAGGVRVHLTNPAGFLLTRAAVRNHKKLALIDDRAAYLGGINFADHNFRWRDLMLRSDDPDLAVFLRDDFLAGFEGRHLPARAHFDGLELHVLDGRSNEARFERVLDLVERAREGIYAECSYVTAPFVEALVRAAARGVAVTVVTPEHNNWPEVKDLMRWLAAHSPVDVRFYAPRLTHMKAMLIDGTTLVTGSANFDIWSYRFQQEYLAVVTDAGVVSEFRRRVVPEGVAGSRPCPRGPLDRRARLAAAKLRWIERVTLALSRRGAPSPLRDVPLRPRTPDAEPTST